MLTVPEAFEKFRGRLEITATEEQSASRRHNQIRDKLVDELPQGAIADHFLTGAYRRETKTKPLRDVDIMVVLSDASLADGPPSDPLETFRKPLAAKYGESSVVIDDRVVRVDFAVDSASTPEEVLSFDVVPAVVDGKNYLIPDVPSGRWIRTDPKRHAELATQANAELSTHWKPVVKMLKKWNYTAGSVMPSSFLIEVMALEIVQGPWGGSWPRELRAFFSTAAERIHEAWKDPANIGPDVLAKDSPNASAIASALRTAEAACTEALRLEREKRVGDALDQWQLLFGPLFAKS